MKRGVIGIYIIKNIADGKVYIGQSVDVEYRICNHFSKLKWNRHDNEHMQRAYNKSPSAFTWELLCECAEAELDEKEIQFIRDYKSADPKYGYNKSYGGQQEHRATEETRRKMSETKKGKKFTPEHCAKIGIANTKRRLSEETKKKISIKRGKPVLQLDMDGKVIGKYISIKEAAEAVGLKSRNSIRNVLIGKAKQSAGFMWKYE